MDAQTQRLEQDTEREVIEARVRAIAALDVPKITGPRIVRRKRTLELRGRIVRASSPVFLGHGLGRNW